jgi:flagellar biosynthesis/type III secretory pathway protein FliH
MTDKSTTGCDCPFDPNLGHSKHCSSQEPQQEGWEKQVDNVALVLARHLKSWDIELRRDIRNLIEKERTEAYNLGKKEGHDEGFEEGLERGFTNGMDIGETKGIRSERERILTALDIKRDVYDDEVNVRNDKYRIEGWNNALAEIRRIIDPKKGE